MRNATHGIERQIELNKLFVLRTMRPAVTLGIAADNDVARKPGGVGRFTEFSGYGAIGQEFALFFEEAVLLFDLSDRKSVV